MKAEGIKIHQIKPCYTFILKLVSHGHCSEGQTNCSQEMHSNKIKWNCTLLLLCLICTLHFNIQYDGMSLNCETGINEVTWFKPGFCMAFIDLMDFKNYTLNNTLGERQKWQEMSSSFILNMEFQGFKRTLYPISILNNFSL